MSDTSTKLRAGNLDSEVREFESLASWEVARIRSLFVAIAELSKNPAMATTIAGLASCGQWVAENLDGNVFDACNQIINKARGVA